MKWLGKIWGALSLIVLAFLIWGGLHWGIIVDWFIAEPVWFWITSAVVFLVPIAVMMVKDKDRQNSRAWSSFAMLCWLVGGGVLWGVANYGGSSSMCTAEPTLSDYDGSQIWPTAPRYKTLGYLGEIFTAGDCGDARLQEVAGNNLTGLTILMKGNKKPSAGLQKIFDELKFTYKSAPDPSPLYGVNGYWESSKSKLTPQEVLRLRPFAKEFAGPPCC